MTNDEKWSLTTILLSLPNLFIVHVVLAPILLPVYVYGLVQEWLEGNWIQE